MWFDGRNRCYFHFDFADWRALRPGHTQAASSQKKDSNDGQRDRCKDPEQWADQIGVDRMTGATNKAIEPLRTSFAWTARKFL